MAETNHAPEHRHRRCRRRRAAAGRLAAVTGSVDPAAWYLFAIVFYWTPPHFWALSLLMKDEYARVGVPMMPVVHGEVGLPALVLFAIVFYWTPPHFWALALRYRGDYAAAGVPMLPVVRGEAETARQIVLYTIALVAVSLLLLPAAGMGWVYLVTAIVLGAMFVTQALRLRADAADGRAATSLFRYSITYLTLLFAAVAVDALVRFPLA